MVKILQRSGVALAVKFWLRFCSTYWLRSSVIPRSIRVRGVYRFRDIIPKLEAIYILSRNAVEPLSELDRSVLLITDGIMTNCELGSLSKLGANSTAHFCHSGAPRWMEEGKWGVEQVEQMRTWTYYEVHGVLAPFRLSINFLFWAASLTLYGKLAIITTFKLSVTTQDGSDSQRCSSDHTWLSRIQGRPG